MADIYPPELGTKVRPEAVATLRSTGTSRRLVRVEIDEPLRSHPVTDRLTYRAIREDMANAVKHADASSVLIRIGQDDTHLTFEVVDDGVGFDTASAGPVGSPRATTHLGDGRRRGRLAGHRLVGRCRFPGLWPTPVVTAAA